MSFLFSADQDHCLSHNSHLQQDNPRLASQPQACSSHSQLYIFQQSLTWWCSREAFSLLPSLLSESGVVCPIQPGQTKAIPYFSCSWRNMPCLCGLHRARMPCRHEHTSQPEGGRNRCHGEFGSRIANQGAEHQVLACCCCCC